MTRSVKFCLSLAIMAIAALAIAPHPARAAYTTSGTNILDSGSVWVGGGVDSEDEWGQNTPSSTYGVKIVREPLDDFQDANDIYASGTSMSAPGGGTLHSLQDMVSDNRAAGEITILCPFNWDGTGSTTFSGEDPDSQSYWSSYLTQLATMATAFSGQTDVWIDPWNEPTFSSDSDWSTCVTDMYNAIRNTGNTSIILIPSEDYDQDTTVFTNSTGTGFLSGKSNVVGDIHAYGDWTEYEYYPSVPSTVVSQSGVTTAIDASIAAGWPLIVGECGPDAQYDGSGDDGPAWGAYPPTHTDFTDCEPFLNNMVSMHIPVVAWNWNSGDADVLQSSGTLTYWGNIFMPYIPDFVPASGATPIAFKQINYTCLSSATSATVAYSSGQTAGDMNVVIVGFGNTTSTVSSVTDSAGNTYFLAIGPTRLTDESQAIYYASNIKSGSNTVTVTFNTSTAYPDIRVLEYAGVNSLDQTAGGTGTASTSSCGPVTTTQANELIVAGNTIDPGTTGAGTGYTERVITSPDGNIAEDEIVTSTGSYSATAPLSGTGNWVMQMATFYNGAGSPPAAPTSLGATGSNGKVSLSWNGSAGATSYNVYRGTSSGGESGTPIATGITGTSYTNTGLTNGTTYYYKVKAVNGNGTSGYSNEASAAGTTPTIAFKQVNYTCLSSATTATVAYNSSQTPGDLNVVIVGFGSITSTVSSVTDSEGNTYHLAIGPTRLTDESQCIYYASGIKSGSNTVTVTFNTSTDYPDIRVLEYSGVSTLDKTAGGTGTAATSSCGPVSTSTADELIVAGNTVDSWATGAGGGYTSRVITSPDGNIAEDETVTSTGSYSSTAPLGATGTWVMQMATFE